MNMMNWEVCLAKEELEGKLGILLFEISGCLKLAGQMPLESLRPHHEAHINSRSCEQERLHALILRG
jgi:hypothetical protein